MAGNAQVGALHVEIGTDVGPFQSGLDAALSSLGGFGKGAVGAFKFAAGAAAGLAASVVGLTAAAVPTTVEYERLQAGLVTATGSVEKASAAFAELEEFAARTPFELAQVTAGFTKLTNMGLDPSIAALTSYGNTASAMGKTLNDMVEAVADAATGEFERLKEFGIKAKSQGDQVSFTFKNITTTVAKESAAIEQYLIGIGETNFAGGMELQSKFLGGALSNLKDAAAGFAASVGAGGLSDALGGVARDLAVATAGSDGLAKSIGEGLGSAITAAWGWIKQVTPAIVEMGKQIAEFLGPSIGELGKAFGELMASPLGPFLAKLAEIVGKVLVVALRLLIDVLTLAVKALTLTANTAGALATRATSAFTGIVESAKALYTGVKTWVGDKLKAALELALAPIRAVKNAFRDLWDAVVGNSYVPDMVDGIETHMRRLDAVMVRPVNAATDEVKAAFASAQAAADSFSTSVPEFPVAPSAGVTAQEIDTGPDFDLPDFRANLPTIVEDGSRKAFQQAFSDGVKAALSGDLKEFTKRWWLETTSKVLENLLNRLGGIIFDSLPTGGGFGGILGGIVKGIGGLLGFGTPQGASKSASAALAPSAKSASVPAVSVSMGARDLASSAIGSDKNAPVVNVYAEGYITEQVLRTMIAEAMVQTGQATQASTIGTIQRRAGKAFT